MPLLALVALFIVVPLAELYVILKVGDAIGAVPTIALLAADSVLGWMLLRTQGRSVWARFNETMAAGRVPHRELIDGVLVVFGGAFLITPGFITDIIGIFLLLPPTRSVFRRLLVTRGSRFLGISFVTNRRRPPGGGAAANGDFDVEGTAVEVDQPRLDK